MSSARKFGVILAAGALVVAAAVLSGGAAQAAPPTASDHTVAGCQTGHPITVHTPRSTSDSAAQLASELNQPANSGVLKKAASQHARWLTTLTCKIRKDKHPELRPTTTQSSYYTTPAWSGYVTDPAGTVPATYAQLAWYVPSVAFVQNTMGASTEEMVVWPGIGGWNGESGSLVQDGTASEAVCNGPTGVSCSSVSTYYYFWLEYVPGEYMQQVTNLVPKPGDDVATSVSYASSTGATFTMCDYTQNVCVSGSQTPGSAPGHSAEWVVERPTFSSAQGDLLLPLPQFSPIPVTSADYQIGSTSYTAAQGSGKSMDIYNGSDHLDSTGSLSSSGQGFTVSWLRAQ